MEFIWKQFLRNINTMSTFNYDMTATFPSKVSIIGAARSGLAAAEYFVKKNVSVFISDTCEVNRLKETLHSRGLESVLFEGNAHTDAVLDSELIILSPGVPSDIPILNRAREKGIPVWSEMELGFRACKASFVAVTGSTGKSTTVSLIREAVKASGIQTVVAGNIGIPVISLVGDLPPQACVVAEVSSFQLETIDMFRPKAAAVLNFMKNHLDRYTSEQDYYAAKKKIAQNFTKDNFLVMNALDPKLMDWAGEIASRVSIIYTGKDIRKNDCIWYDNDTIQYRLNGKEGVLLYTSDMKIKGFHNYQNACSAAAIAMIVGGDIMSIAKGICSFKGLEHRLEYVTDINGVSWFNDSKSTTAESMVAAIEAFPRVHLIAGGRDKGCEFSEVNNAIRNHACGVYLIGEASKRMKDVWNECAPIEVAESLDDAITQINRVAVRGDAVVFSPGCSSFDMFRNYEERGNVFKKLVHNLQGIAKF